MTQTLRPDSFLRTAWQDNKKLAVCSAALAAVLAVGSAHGATLNLTLTKYDLTPCTPRSVTGKDQYGAKTQVTNICGSGPVKVSLTIANVPNNYTGDINGHYGYSPDPNDTKSPVMVTSGIDPHIQVIASGISLSSSDTSYMVNEINDTFPSSVNTGKLGTNWSISFANGVVDTFDVSIAMNKRAWSYAGTSSEGKVQHSEDL